MNINALSRQTLISAGGLLEKTVFPDKYSLAMSCNMYKKWDFTKQTLPADLIDRSWVHDYVHIYYRDDEEIQNENELKEWWNEVRTKGHGDLKNEPWWPKMYTREELIQSCTIIIWEASALHAAVNFGQYHPYGGYLPNRPA
ncbi:putative linoleate 9S-lipoxygenase [Helianthus anomalus]